MGLEVVEQLQHGICGILAVAGGGSEVVVDTAGKGPDAVYAAGPPGEVEEGAVSGRLHPLRKQVQYILLICKDIRAAHAATAGGTPGGGSYAVAECVGKNAVAEPVGDTVKEGYPAPVVLPCPIGPDDPPLQLFNLGVEHVSRMCGGRSRHGCDYSGRSGNFQAAMGLLADNLFGDAVDAEGGKVVQAGFGVAHGYPAEVILTNGTEAEVAGNALTSGSGPADMAQPWRIHIFIVRSTTHPLRPHPFGSD